ncbi:unnamed protein product [Dovyalis caffra]|uniref:Uncharacterized protein n=1 Tax=Dovyalis caffra TaxID=77055 RepID=A0AAV1RHH0_9ROSI|nr:unnamed protein product [Dovyalis caffra]
MLLRNSISSTKKFFQKTVQSFKSFFSSDHYQKLPKDPTHDGTYSSFTVGVDMKAQTNFINNKDLENFYNDFPNRWDDADKEKSKRDKKKTISAPSSSSTKQERDHDLNSSFLKFSKATAAKNYQYLRRRDQDYTYDDPKYEMKSAYARKTSQLDDNSSSRHITSEGRSFLVAQKLKELEMMDVSNVEHVLDIEEVLHYYSRLTCPAYLDIVDKFFMNMYAEFFAPPVSPRSVNSRPRLRSVGS